MPLLRNHRNRSRSGLSWWTIGVTTTVGWSVLAFGGVYPWGYVPALIGCAFCGLGGLVQGGRAGWLLTRSLQLGFVLTVTAIALQIIPLDRTTLIRISPAIDTVLLDRDLSYSYAIAGGPAAAAGVRHELSVAPALTKLALTFGGCLALFMVGGAATLSRRTARQMATFLSVLGVAVLLIGLVQKATWNGKMYGILTTIDGGNPFGPFVNRNHFACWMLMALSMTAALFTQSVLRISRLHGSSDRQPSWIYAPDTSKVVLVGFVVLTMTLSILLTMSRSGMIGLAVCVTGFVFVGLNRQRARARRFILIGIPVSMLVVSALWAGVDVLAARFQNTGMADVSGRIPLWENSWSIVRSFPLAGTGLNTYGVAMSRYQVYDLAHSYSAAHNDYLQLLVEGGLLVAIPSALTVAAFVSLVRRRLREDAADGGASLLRWGAVIGIMSVAVQEIAEFGLQIPANAITFSLLCAIALSRGGLSDQRT